MPPRPNAFSYFGYNAITAIRKCAILGCKQLEFPCR
jgi:hypothetical protein